MKTLLLVRELCLVVLLCTWIVGMVVMVDCLYRPFTVKLQLPQESLKMEVKPLSFDLAKAQFPPIKVDGLKDINFKLDFSSIQIPDVSLTLPAFPSSFDLNLKGMPEKFALEGFPTQLNLNTPEKLVIETPKTLKVEGQLLWIPVSRCR